LVLGRCLAGFGLIWAGFGSVCLVCVGLVLNLFLAGFRPGLGWFGQVLCRFLAGFGTCFGPFWPGVEDIRPEERI
jgi:hypothetical protein